MLKKVKKTGSALLLTILIMAAIFATAIAFASFIINSSQRTRLIADSYKAFYEAESGTEQALFMMRKNQDEPGSGTCISGCSWTVTRSPNISAAKLVSDRGLQFDITNLASGDIGISIANCQGKDAVNPASWIEITYIPYVNNRPDFVNTKKYLAVCPPSPGVAISPPLFGSAAGYNVKIKALYDEISSLSVSGVGAEISSEVSIASNSRVGFASQNITVTLPRRSPAADLYDYVVFSEKTIHKADLPAPGGGSGSGSGG